jgi:hypothetical protein
LLSPTKPRTCRQPRLCRSTARTHSVRCSLTRQRLILRLFRPLAPPSCHGFRSTSNSHGQKGCKPPLPLRGGEGRLCRIHDNRLTVDQVARVQGCYVVELSESLSYVQDLRPRTTVIFGKGLDHGERVHLWVDIDRDELHRGSVALVHWSELGVSVSACAAVCGGKVQDGRLARGKRNRLTGNILDREGRRCITHRCAHNPGRRYSPVAAQPDPTDQGQHHNGCASDPPPRRGPTRGSPISLALCWVAWPRRLAHGSSSHLRHRFRVRIPWLALLAHCITNTMMHSACGSSIVEARERPQGGA